MAREGRCMRARKNVCKWKATHLNANDVGEQLHDRATRGVELTAEEQAQLNEWYAEQDRVEAAVLSRPTSAQPLDALHAQVDRVMVQLDDVTQRIQTLSAENVLFGKKLPSCSDGWRPSQRLSQHDDTSARHPSQRFFYKPANSIACKPGTTSPASRTMWG